MLPEEEQHHPLPLEKERRWDHVPWKLNQISNRADQLPKDLGFKFLIRIFTCFHCFVWHRFAQFKFLFSYLFDSSYKTLCTIGPITKIRSLLLELLHKIVNSKYQGNQRISIFLINVCIYYIKWYYSKLEVESTLILSVTSENSPKMRADVLSEHTVKLFTTLMLYVF